MTPEITDDEKTHDKVLRTQNLRRLRDQGEQKDDVITCMVGLGFNVRRKDMGVWFRKPKAECSRQRQHLLIDQTRIKEHRVR